MKLNKLIAALSAVTILGSLAVVPAAYASNAQYESDSVTLTVKDQTSNVTTTTTVEDKDIAVTINNSSIWYLGTYDVSTIDSVSAHAALCPNSAGTENPILKLGYMPISNDTVIDTTYITTNKDTIRSAQNLIAQHSGRTQDTVTAPSKLSDLSDISLTFDNIPVGNSALFVYATAQNRRVLIDTVTINFKPSLTAEPNETLYYGETVTFKANFENAAISFEPVNDTDMAQYFTDNQNGSYTYNNKGRQGEDVNDATGTIGRIKVTATADDKTASTYIYTNRLRHISYNITDNSSEAPAMTVTALVNGSQAYSKSVEYGSMQHGNDNLYSGHSNYSMTFTVPDGYVLTISEKEGYNIENSGNKVIVTNTTDLDNDFIVNGTLEKAATFNTDYFNFSIPDAAFDDSDSITFNTAEVNVTENNVTKTGTANLSTTITAKKGTGLYVNITGVPNGVTVNSITLK